MGRDAVRPFASPHSRGTHRERKERERGLHIKQHPLTQCRLCQVGGGEGPRWNARGGERRRRDGGMEKERREERSGGKAGRGRGRIKTELRQIRF